MAVLNPAPKSASGLWFFSPTVDLLCLGGITFFFIFLFDTHGALPVGLPHLFQGIGWVPIATFVGSVLVNYPHYAATYYRVYRRGGEVKKYAFESVWSPLLLAVVGVAALFSPAGFAPWYCMGYILTSGYHYSGQTYGISLIYAGKSGIRFNTWQKWCILLPVYCVYLYPTINGNTPDAKTITFFGVQLPALNIPPVFSVLLLDLFYAGLGLYVILNFYLWFAQKKRLPGIVHVVVFAQIIWYSVGSMVPGFFSFVPFFHCLQYLVITAYFDFKEVLAGHPERIPATSAHYLRSFWFGRYYLWQVIVGSILFLLLPLLISGFGLASLPLAAAVVVSFLNMHHFVLDGAIWKLRKPEVGQPLFT